MRCRIGFFPARRELHQQRRGFRVLQSRSVLGHFCQAGYFDGSHPTSNMWDKAVPVITISFYRSVPPRSSNCKGTRKLLTDQRDTLAGPWEMRLQVEELVARTQ